MSPNFTLQAAILLVVMEESAVVYLPLFTVTAPMAPQDHTASTQVFSAHDQKHVSLVG